MLSTTHASIPGQSRLVMAPWGLGAAGGGGIELGAPLAGETVFFGGTTAEGAIGTLVPGGVRVLDTGAEADAGGTVAADLSGAEPKVGG